MGSDFMLRFNIRQIEAFRAVIETGNMTQAGEVLGVTQPAISRLIRDLEEEYGLQLFARHAGRIDPTLLDPDDLGTGADRPTRRRTRDSGGR